MRRILFVSLCVFFGIGCKTTRKNPTLLKVIQRTPETGVSGVLDKAPLLIEAGKPAVVSLNKKAGAPPADSQLRVERLFLTLRAGDYSACKPKLTAARFTETVEADILKPDDFKNAPVFRDQELSMAITGDAEQGWTLTLDGGHDIGDLYLSFETAGPQACQATAVAHGYYAVAGTASWGTGSGDPDLDKLVRGWGSDRGHRLWHFLWHGMRSQWPEMDQADRDSLIGYYGENIAPPARTEPRGPRGEDFLYMHHQMLGNIRLFLQSKGKPMVPSWKTVPRFGDLNYPSAPTETTQEQFDAWEKDYQDPEKIKAMTLGEYGELIESTIHNTMHMRFRNPNDMDVADPFDWEWEQKYSKLYDDPSYDYLGSTYSSHVNPVFFMLHGWVDDRIQTWLGAHGFKKIGDQKECGNQPDCYVWLSDKAYEKAGLTPWEGVVPGPLRSGASLHSQHLLPQGVPKLSLKARAQLYKTRRMGGF